MIEPTPYSFLSPRERIRTLAVQAIDSYRPDLEPPSLSSRYRPVHEAIKAYYLANGHDLEVWHHVTSSPALFNRVWCSMLGIKYENSPPSPVWRFEIPSINQLIN